MSSRKRVLKSEFSKASSRKRVLKSKFSKANSRKRVSERGFSKVSSQKWVLESEFSKAISRKRVIESEFSKASSRKRILESEFSKASNNALACLVGEWQKGNKNVFSLVEWWPQASFLKKWHHQTINISLWSFCSSCSQLLDTIRVFIYHSAQLVTWHVILKQNRW
jgi:hypothetical protein